MTDEELWAQHYPDVKIPGTEQPVEGRCGAKIRNKDMKDLGIERYCGRPAGWGTSHQGIDRCKLHGGGTPTQSRPAVKAKIQKELVSLSERLGEPEPILPPEVEAFRLAGKMKAWSNALEEKLAELNGILEVTDKAGIEHTRALIEILERSWDRFQKALEFLLKFDLQKRIVALEEHQASMVGAAFMAVILSRDLKLNEKQIETARALFASSMSELGDSVTPSWALNLIEGEVIE